MRIIMFISLRMTGAESRYATTEQAALAVLQCLQEVRWLVHGSQFPVIVYTNHSALIHLLKHDDAHGKMARWQLKLSEYDLEHVHIAGTQNVIADGLSWMPARYFDEQVGKRTELREMGDQREEKIGNKRRKKNGQGREKGKQNHEEDEEELEREMEVLAVERVLDQRYGMRGRRVNGMENWLGSCCGVISGEGMLLQWAGGRFGCGGRDFSGLMGRGGKDCFIRKEEGSYHCACWRRTSSAY